MFDDDKFIEARELEEMGISAATIYYHTNTKRDWLFTMSPRQGRSAPRKLIEIASLPLELRRQIEKRRTSTDEADRSSVSDPSSSSSIDRLALALMRFPSGERDAWMTEITRLSAIIERYDAVTPKRIAGQPSPVIGPLCAEAACTDKTILAREPRRAVAPSQSTLDRWLAGYRKSGGACFLRETTKAERADDKRKAPMSDDAMQWVNDRWRQFRGPKHCYDALRKRATKEGWIIPSLAWFVRRWNDLPRIVSSSHLGGKKAYVFGFAPFVPRDYSDLEALQVLCGDHSERDVTVLLKDGSIARPWLTVWQCLRSGLIWGWHLDTVPSSHTIGLAYANGVRAFGAQPISRPADDYYSWLYTDQGKDYKSHRWNGEITVHERAAKFDGGIELLRVERKIGLFNDTDLKQLLARGYNAREKFVERTHRDISDWEENTFEEWCGRDAKFKPDTWREMYAQHAKFAKGKRSSSPFIGFDEYRDALGGWIQEYNSKEHRRSTLGGAVIVPLEEYRRLYTTRYEISEEALALLLMRADKRLVRKNGIQFGRANWWYHHPELAKHKGHEVEIRYDDADYSRLWVFLPARAGQRPEICEATLITPTSLLNPNKATLGVVKTAEAQERKLIRDHRLLNHSMVRGETAEDRVAAELAEQEQEERIEAVAGGGLQASVHRLTRMDGHKLRAVSRGISAVDAATIAADDSIFESGDSGPGRVREFDYED